MLTAIFAPLAATATAARIQSFMPRSNGAPMGANTLSSR